MDTSYLRSTTLGKLNKAHLIVNNNNSINTNNHSSLPAKLLTTPPLTTPTISTATPGTPPGEPPTVQKINQKNVQNLVDLYWKLNSNEKLLFLIQVGDKQQATM